MCINIFNLTHAFKAVVNAPVHAVTIEFSDFIAVVRLQWVQIFCEKHQIHKYNRSLHTSIMSGMSHLDWSPVSRTGIGQPLRKIHHLHNIVLSR